MEVLKLRRLFSGAGTLVIRPLLRRHNDTVSRATNTSAPATAAPPLTLSSPRLPAHCRALFITSSLPSLLSPSVSPPPTLCPLSPPSQTPCRHLGFPPSCAPHLFLTLTNTPRQPPPSPPFSQLVCLCAATQPISAHPACAGSLTQPLWRT